MNYDELVTSISAIINNDDIIKLGLTLVYELPEKNHRQMNEDFFFRNNPINAIPTYSDVFEAEVEGIVIKFVKKTL